MCDIDKAIGSRIRLYRKRKGMSQTDLANKIGVRFQQVQKYEAGINRVAASRLWVIAESLDQPVSALFLEMAPESEACGDCTEMLDVFQTLPGHKRTRALSYLRDLKVMELGTGARA